MSVTVLLALAMLANAGLGVGVYATREPAPKPLTAERIETASRPAIVLIQSNYTIGASLRDMIIPDAKFNQLVDKIQAMINSGQITSQSQEYHVAVNLVASNPAEYYGPGDVSTGTFDFVATGSGFFVTQDGYLVTAAHVVSADKTDIRNRAVASYKTPDAVAQDKAELAKNLINELGLNGLGVSVTPAQQDNLEAFWQQWVAKYLSIDKIDAKYYLGSGNVQAGDGLTANGARASVVSIDPTSTGHDVAIMKANLTGVPTLPLATGAPQMGDATYAIGYPRTGYLEESVPLNQVVPATMSTGKVATTDVRSTGWTAYGTTAAFTHGDSGGPVVDATGKVMGIVSYSRLDGQGNQVYGGGYFIPTEYISADLAAASVKPDDARTDLTSTYYHALAEGDIHRYKIELPLLESIQSRSPFDAYVKDDITSTQSEILAGNDQTPPDLTVYVPWAALSAATVIALTMFAWFGLAVTTRRAKVAAVSVSPPVEVVPSPSPQVAAWPQPAVEVVVSAHDVLRESEPVATPVAPAGEAPPPAADAPGA